MLTNERLCRRHFTARDLPRLRIEVEECAAWAGLGEPRRGEFVVAVDAVVTNAVEHAGGAGRLLLRHLGSELECQVEDSGPGFSEDVIPELAPGVAGATAGRGLWLARLVTDRLTVGRAAPAPGGLGGGGGAGGGLGGSGTGPGALVTLAMRLPGPGG
jgi:anti-sigma regulatory factor (Ser/Thr protein kinase)